MKYRLDFSQKFDVSAPSVTGAMVGAPLPSAFFAWLPSTWPAVPVAVDENFIRLLKRIFEEAILGEISNVIADVQRSQKDLQHRGHVIAIALMCAVDAISSYGYRNRRVAGFIGAHFPHEYRPHAGEIYGLYRSSLVHKWNLFEASIHPDHSGIRLESGVLAFGLLNFFDALAQATGDFLKSLETDTALQANTLARYRKLRQTAKA
jgi:hypothetical protein